MSEADYSDIQLEMKDRLNYPLILETTMKNFKQAMTVDNPNVNKLNTMIIDFFTDIPSSWYDKEFADDVQKCVKTKKVPNKIRWSGVLMSEKYLEKHKIPKYREIKVFDYFSLKNAIVNLLDRLNMLVRKEKIEQSTGKNLKFETLDDLIDSMDEDDEEN